MDAPQIYIFSMVIQCLFAYYTCTCYYINYFEYLRWFYILMKFSLCPSVLQSTPSWLLHVSVRSKTNLFMFTNGNPCKTFFIHVLLFDRDLRTCGPPDWLLRKSLVALLSFYFDAKHRGTLTPCFYHTFWQLNSYRSVLRKSISKRFRRRQIRNFTCLLEHLKTTITTLFKAYF